MDFLIEVVKNLAVGFIGGVAGYFATRAWKWWSMKGAIDRLCGTFHTFKDGVRIPNETVVVRRVGWNTIELVSEGSEDGTWRSEVVIDEGRPHVGSGNYRYDPPADGAGVHTVQYNPHDGTITVNARNTSHPEKYPTPAGYVLKRIATPLPART